MPSGVQFLSTGDVLHLSRDSSLSSFGQTSSGQTYGWQIYQQSSQLARGIPGWDIRPGII